MVQKLRLWLGLLHPKWKSLGSCPSSTYSFWFLWMDTPGSTRDGSGNCILASCVTDSDWILCSWLWPGLVLVVVGIWGISVYQWMGDLCFWIFSSQLHKYKYISKNLKDVTIMFELKFLNSRYNCTLRGGHWECAMLAEFSLWCHSLLTLTWTSIMNEQGDYQQNKIPAHMNIY